MNTEAPTIPAAVSLVRQTICRLDEIAWYLKSRPEFAERSGRIHGSEWWICLRGDEFDSAVAALGPDAVRVVDGTYETVTLTLPFGGQVVVIRLAYGVEGSHADCTICRDSQARIDGAA